MKTAQGRIDTFLVHDPGVSKEQTLAEMMAASGSGLDPNISPASAFLRVASVAKVRKPDAAKVNAFVSQHTEKGGLWPDVVNVLKLNIALGALK